MLVSQNKKYFLAPTYQQINRILNKGWRLEAVNSVPCVKGDLVSIVDSEKNILFLLNSVGRVNSIIVCNVFCIIRYGRKNSISKQ